MNSLIWLTLFNVPASWFKFRLWIWDVTFGLVQTGFTIGRVFKSWIFESSFAFTSETLSLLKLLNALWLEWIFLGESEGSSGFLLPSFSLVIENNTSGVSNEDTFASSFELDTASLQCSWMILLISSSPMLSTINFDGSSVLCSFLILLKNFCAWLLICVPVLVPMNFSTFFQFFPYCFRPSMNRMCSSWVHLPVDLPSFEALVSLFVWLFRS